MNNFTPGRSQDASPTIRGFWYQIEVTIERWLRLKSCETLELERGEDIDRLSKSDALDIQRELEQVKVRAANITLRSSSALESLSNFAYHTSANPDSDMRFLYTTTALVGRERLSPFPEGAKGIDIWNSIREKSTLTASDVAHLESIRQFLLGMDKPSGCNGEAWGEFHNVLAGTHRLSFEQFVRRIEGSCGNLDPNSLKIQLVSKIKSIDSSDDLAAKQRYEQLIVHVLELLSKDGEKRLTQQLLQEVLLQPTVAESDRTRISELERLTQSHGDEIHAIKDIVDRLTIAGNVLTVFGLDDNQLPSLDVAMSLPAPPPLVNNLARRDDAVKAILNEYECPWIALHAGYGMGKSHLAFLLAEGLGQVCLGISMRGLKEEDAGRSLLRMISMIPIANLLTSSDGVVIIDDVPELTPGSILEDSLLQLAALASSCRIVSTSRYVFTRSLIDRSPVNIQQLTSPSFSDTDASELLLANGVDPEIVSGGKITSLNVLCNGHPVLLTALARHLIVNREQQGEAIARALLGEHRVDVDAETARVVLDTVESEHCRELLFRLASVQLPVNVVEIRKLAEVEPPLHEPSMCISRLSGLWLRTVEGGRFEISPLVLPFGADIGGAVQRRLHDAFARIILSRKVLSALEFTRLILSLIIAQQYDVAAIFIVKGHLKVRSSNIEPDALNLSIYFPIDRDAGLSPISEIPLRASQAVIRHSLGSDIGPYLDRMNVLVSVVSVESIIGAMQGGSILIAAATSIPAEAAIYGAKLIEYATQSDQYPEQLQNAWPEQLAGMHIVLAMAAVSTWQEVVKFVDLLESIQRERRIVLASHDDFRTGIQVMFFSALFDNNADITPQSEEYTAELEERCFRLGLIDLSVNAAVCRLIMKGEYDKDVEGMLAEGERAQKRFAAYPQAVGKLEVYIGQQLYFNKRARDGLQRLAIGLAVEGAIVGIERANRLVDALCAAWEEDGGQDAYADELEELIKIEEISSTELQCQYCAQLSIIRWKQGKRIEAFRLIERAVSHFINMAGSPRVGEFGAALGHCLAYYGSIANTGRPPEKAADGEPFSDPMPRIFSGRNALMAKLWRERQGLAYLKWLVGTLAEGLECTEEARYWHDAAYEEAVQKNIPGMLMIMSPRALVSASHACDWESAIEAALVYGRTSTLIIGYEGETIDLMGDDIGFVSLKQFDDKSQEVKAQQASINILARALILACTINKDNGGDRLITSVPKLLAAIDVVKKTSPIAYMWEAIQKVLSVSTADVLEPEEAKELYVLLQGTECSLSCQMLAHAMVSLRDDVDPRQAVMSHIGIAKVFDVENTRVAFPVDDYPLAISNMWRTKYNNTRFMYSTPRSVEGALEEASKLDCWGELRATLKAISNGLGVVLDVETREWLDGRPRSR